MLCEWYRTCYKPGRLLKWSGNRQHTQSSYLLFNRSKYIPYGTLCDWNFKFTSICPFFPQMMKERSKAVYADLLFYISNEADECFWNGSWQNSAVTGKDTSYACFIFTLAQQNSVTEIQTIRSFTWWTSGGGDISLHEFHVLFKFGELGYVNSQLVEMFDGEWYVFFKNFVSKVFMWVFKWCY